MKRGDPIEVGSHVRVPGRSIGAWGRVEAIEQGLVKVNLSRHHEWHTLAAVETTMKAHWDRIDGMRDWARQVRLKRAAERKRWAEHRAAWAARRAGQQA